MSLRDIPTTYEEAEDFIGDREERTVANNTKVVRLRDGQGYHYAFGIVHYSTTIAEFLPDGRLYLTCHNSVTTKQRLNIIIGSRPFRVANGEPYTPYLWRIRKVYPSYEEALDGITYGSRMFPYKVKHEKVCEFLTGDSVVLVPPHARNNGDDWEAV